ncbi:MAG: hypothetical protein B6D46_05950 [Polyangiaceae bacterium UTPRO1]|jgi:O-antigen/teichoic acid export membrane protein/glycosyltransferase involved in cell wall biosynthesis|nr:glycosyltransferase [Myxococcales bacterium]OQY67566.1 MAG: hypothetical protein B6D46_05950 [Polyangiaceae bacterium UTPRO1]
MKLLLVFDHRFQRRSDGVVFSLKHYGHSFFARRYLRVFDEVTIVARVANAMAEYAGGDAEPTEGAGVRVVSLGDWQGPLGLARAWWSIRRSLAAQLDAAEAVVLVAPGMLAALARGMLARRRQAYGVEVVGDPWDALAPGSLRHPLRPLLRAAARRGLRRLCAEAAAVSYVTQAALQRRYPTSGHAVGVSDVVLPAAAFAAAPRTFTSGAPRTLITVGTMAQLYKAQDVLIDAVARCSGDGLDLRLVLVGDGGYRTALAERAARLGIADRVRFTGGLAAGPAVRAELDAADCFVLPSRQEGLPRALVEAMARGLPCIGSTVGGIPELLPETDLVPPDDAAALAAKLREVLGDAARLAGAAARNLAAAAAYRDELLDEKRLDFYARLREASTPAASGDAGGRISAAAPSLKRNALWAVLGNVGYAACQCAVLVALAKLSSPEDVGRFALALAITAPIMIAASLQLRVVQATDACDVYPFGAYLGVRLVATALALAVIVAVAGAAGYPRATVALIVLVALAKAFESVSDVIFGLLQQHEDLKRVALSMLAKGGISVTAIGLGLVTTGDLLAATSLMALAWGAWLGFYDLPAARRLTAVRPLFDRDTLARLAWTALPMGIVAGLQSLMTNVPRYALEAYGGPRALGYFAGLAYLVAAGNQPMMALAAAVSPRLARLFVGDRAAYRRLLRRTMLAAAGMGVATVGGGAAIGAPILARLYTADYAVHADALVWLAAAAAVGYQASVFCSGITAARRFPEQLAVAAITLAATGVASALFVPRFGLVGAAWALLAAALVQAACLGAVYVRVSSARGGADPAAAAGAARPAAEPALAMQPASTVPAS